MEIFVRRPVLAVVISLAFLLVGAYAAVKISVLQFPKIENSAIIINTAYPGASAEVCDSGHCGITQFGGLLRLFTE